MKPAKPIKPPVKVEPVPSDAQRFPHLEELERAIERQARAAELAAWWRFED